MEFTAKVVLLFVCSFFFKLNQNYFYDLVVFCFGSLVVLDVMSRYLS